MKNKIKLTFCLFFLVAQLLAQDLNFTRFNQPSEAEYSLKEHNLLMQKASDYYVKKIKKRRSFRVSLIPSFTIPGYTSYALRKIESPFDTGAKKTNVTVGIGGLFSLLSIRTSVQLKRKEKEFKNIENDYYNLALNSKKDGLYYSVYSEYNKEDKYKLDNGVQGYVKNQAGETLIGATIYLNGTSVGAVTDIYGAFSIPNLEGANKMTVSYAGYVTQKVAIGNATNVNVILTTGASSKRSKGWLSTSVSAGVPLVNRSSKKVSEPATAKYDKATIFYPSKIRENYFLNAQVGIRFSYKMGLRFNLSYNNFETEYTKKSTNSSNNSSITLFTGIPIVDTIYQINKQLTLKGGYYFKVGSLANIQLSGLLSHRSVRSFEKSETVGDSRFLFYDLGQLYGAGIDLNFLKFQFSLSHSLKNRASTEYHLTDFNMRWNKYFRGPFNIFFDFGAERESLRIGPSKVITLTPKINFGVNWLLF